MGTANGDWWHIKTINATLVSITLFGRYYITKRTRQIAANLAIYAAFLVVKIISIGYFKFLIIISSHSM